MFFAQFGLGLVLILIALAALALGVFALCRLILFASRWLPLVGGRHRHPAWSTDNRTALRP
jgi:hypothetical protein